MVAVVVGVAVGVAVVVAVGVGVGVAVVVGVGVGVAVAVAVVVAVVVVVGVVVAVGVGMILGFTGTRKGCTPPQLAALRSFLGLYRPGVLLHGGAVGADAEAHYLGIIDCRMADRGLPGLR